MMNKLKHQNEPFQNWLSGIMGSSDLAVIGISATGKICGWNAKAAELYGYRAEEVIGKSPKVLHTTEHQEDLDKIYPIKNNTSFTKYYETTRRRKDGESIPLEVFILPVRDSDNNIMGFAEIAFDVTNKKQTEAEKKNYIKELEYRNQTLARFTYMVAHDLKTPLATIKGYSKLLLKEAGEKFKKKEQESLNYVIKGIQRMDHLINSLLTLSRETKKSENYPAINTQLLVKQVLHDLEVIIKETNGQIKVGQLPKVQGDPAQLSSVFLNLISNALRYNKSGKPYVQITCNTKKEEYQFVIKDNGIGIKPADLKRIFDPFERLEDGIKNKGSGLGLALSKKIIESHGGKIWVKSSSKGGSVFCFTLPRQEN